jgi:hypothetical protein
MSRILVVVLIYHRHKYIPMLLKETHDYVGALGSVVVKTLCYKPKGPGFDTR